MTGKYLGRITETDGLIQPKEKEEKMTKVSLKEYGASSVLVETGSDIYTALKEIFPNEADRIFTLAILRVIEKCPFKRAEMIYEKSYLSEMYGGVKAMRKRYHRISDVIRCESRKACDFYEPVYFRFESIYYSNVTNIISKSNEMEINRLGYNSHRQYDPQVNLLYAFACESRMPVYYSVLPGNIREISALRLSVEEAQLKNVIIVADKGFGFQG